MLTPPCTSLRETEIEGGGTPIGTPRLVTRIYLSPPHVFGDERALVEEAFSSNWIAPCGPHLDAFEAEFAAAVDVPFAVALSSGTAGLHLAMRLLEIGPGDEVICASMTFSASANPILYERATPVFVDCDRTWTIDPNLLEDALNAAQRGGKKPKAVVAVDLYGQCADYDAVSALCARFGVPLIEDAAEALGATYRGRPSGGFGRLGVFSFNGNKIITTSGGGMLVSAERALMERARFLATQARDPAPHYQHSALGFNYRLSNVLAAIGRGQLRTLGDRVATRRRIFQNYEQGLGGLPGISMMPEAPYGTGNRWLTCITIDPERFGATREDVRIALERENIESRPVWMPMHMQPLFRSTAVYGGSVSERLFKDGLCLPSGSNLNVEDQQRIIAIICRIGKRAD
jgi:dTDP-4-amino-4,6-dideoxygalactose transaminase